MTRFVPTQSLKASDADESPTGAPHHGPPGSRSLDFTESTRRGINALTSCPRNMTPTPSSVKPRGTYALCEASCPASVCKPTFTGSTCEPPPESSPVCPTEKYRLDDLLTSLARSAGKSLPSRPLRARKQPRDELHVQAQSWEASSRLLDGRHPRTVQLLARNHWELSGSRARLGNACRLRNQHRRSHRRRLALELTRPICLRQLQGPALHPQPVLAGTRQMTPLGKLTTLTGSRHPQPDAAAGVLPSFRNTSLG